MLTPTEICVVWKYFGTCCWGYPGSVWKHKFTGLVNTVQYRYFDNSNIVRGNTPRQQRGTLDECNPEILDMVEKIREKAMYPDNIDTKTAQMILFAVLLSHVAPATEFHARGAMRAGATKKELHDVSALVFLFRGLPAFNLGAQIINEVFDDPDKKIGNIFEN